jgi:hypothetical protein
MASRCLALWVGVALAACEIPGRAPAPSPSPSAAAVEDQRVTRARAALSAAEAQPLPTPEPPPSPRPRNWKPLPAPEFKPGEVEAIGLLEQAAAADARGPEAHELLAGVLEGPAVRRHEAARAAKAAKRGTAAAPAPPDQGVDASPARVARAYRAAVEATPGTAEPLLDRFIAFSVKVEDHASADWAYQERIRRAKENATAGPLEAYGDFLLDVRKDPLAAAEQYRNVLIWKPGDARVRDRLARIHLEAARGHLEQQQFAAAETQVREAAKHVDAGTPSAAVLAGYQARLKAIRR